MEKPTEEKRAIAVVELAKQLLPSIVSAMGPVPPNATSTEVAKHYDTACNASFSLAGMFRRKSIELVESAKKVDEKNAS